MALVLSKETASGAIAQYWKINTIQISITDNYNNHINSRLSYNILVTLSGYIDENARTLSKSQLDDLYYTINSNITIGPEVDLRPQLYTYLKTLPEWENAIDG